MVQAGLPYPHPVGAEQEIPKDKPDENCGYMRASRGTTIHPQGGLAARSTGLSPMAKLSGIEPLHSESAISSLENIPPTPAFGIHKAAGASTLSLRSTTSTLMPFPKHGSPTGWSINTVTTLPDDSCEAIPIARKKSLAEELLKGVHRKQLKGNRWISQPRPGAQDEWNHEEDRATEWLSLFYAVLGIFMTQHEIETPAHIPIFLSFFTIIFWTWCSQTAYDMRFQGDDALHRLFKFLQVILFIYQGASSGNWNPGKIQVWDHDSESNADDYGAKLASHRDAARSWLTVVVAFAVSRALLAVQYGICAYQGHRAKRHVKHILLTIDALCISLVLATASAALPSTSYQMKIAKIAIFYLAIFIEMADEWGQVLLKMTHHVPTERIGERYGAFLLIVIGEGIIMITRAFNKAIGGLSDDDTSTYFLVFLTILVVYLLWSFLFSNFDKNDHTGHGRVAIWQTLHFPLTFTILLVMAGMVNVVVVTSAAHGIRLVLSDVGSVSRQTLLTGQMPVEEIKRANRYMYKLELEPRFPEQIEYLDALHDRADPQEDWYIVLDQYIGQIVYNTFGSYGIEIPDVAQELYSELYAINSTWHPHELAREANREHADVLLEALVGEIMVDMFTGILWVLPASGCVLVLCALRSMTWYRFTGIAHNLLHLPQIMLGITLSLLGLLDLGPKQFDIDSLDSKDHFVTHVNPLYRTILEKAPLVIVAVVYLVVWLVTAGGLWWDERRRQGKMGNEQEAEGDEERLVLSRMGSK